MFFLNLTRKPVTNQPNSFSYKLLVCLSKNYYCSSLMSRCFSRNCLKNYSIKCTIKFRHPFRRVLRNYLDSNIKNPLYNSNCSTLVYGILFSICSLQVNISACCSGYDLSPEFERKPVLFLRKTSTFTSGSVALIASFRGVSLVGLIGQQTIKEIFCVANIEYHFWKSREQLNDWD